MSKMQRTQKEIDDDQDALMQLVASLNMHDDNCAYCAGNGCQKCIGSDEIMELNPLIVIKHPTHPIAMAGYTSQEMATA